MVCRVRQSTPDRQFPMDDSLGMMDSDSQEAMSDFNDDDSDLITDPEDYYLDVSI